MINDAEERYLEKLADRQLAQEDHAGRYCVSCTLSGYRYTGYQQTWRTKLPQRVRFVAEPDNPHDPRAIRVEAGQRKIGYLPRYIVERITVADIDRLEGANGIWSDYQLQFWLTRPVTDFGWQFGEFI